MLSFESDYIIGAHWKNGKKVDCDIWWDKNKIETIRTQAEQGNKQIVIEHTKLYFFVY